MKDIDVADLNNDGYNDLVVAVDDAGDNYIKVYLNNTEGNINSAETYSNSTFEVNKGNSISTGDFNKDGWKELLVGRDSAVAIFLNFGVDSLFLQGAYQKHYFTDELNPVKGKKIITADLHNQGGLSVVYVGEIANFANFDEGYRMNANTIDKAPAPPLIFKQSVTVAEDQIPRIRLFSRGDKDFDHFRLFKKSPNTSDEWVLLADNLQSDSYVDSTETLIFGLGQNYPPNLFYAASSVDASDFESIQSDTIDYITHGSEEDPEDRFSINNDPGKPEKYSISNYPNPFNPSTNITFDLPVDNFVTIKIYDLLGKEVVSLVNEPKQAGSYKITFNASNLPSGIYYYKIKAGSYEQVRKMLLLK